MSKTRIFVSSTCFDLHQIRRDLEDFVRHIGFEPVLSDSKDVAVPAGLDKVEACRWLVRSSDIFVLIIGGRFGTTDGQTGQSITNIEYETAYEARMPIYPFVDQEVWAQRDTYRRLREMVTAGSLPEGKLKQALGGKIEDPRVFQFLEQVASAGRDAWIHPFDEAKDIIEKLRNSLSVLVRELLFERRSSRSRRRIAEPLPRLSIEWEGMDVLSVQPISSISVSDAIAQLEGLQVSKVTLAKLEKRRNEINKLIRPSGRPRSLQRALGVGVTESEPADEPVECVFDFVKRIEYLSSLVRNSPEEFLWRHELSERVVRPTIGVTNDGYCPADGVVVYISPSEAIKFLTNDEVAVQTLALPSKRPKDVERVLALLAGKPDPAADNLHLLLAGHLGQPIGTRSSLVSPLSGFSLSGPDETVENGTIRLDLNSRIKHGFLKSVTLERTCIASMTASGKQEAELDYVCHADNLPTPSRGKLRVRAHRDPG